MVNTPSGNRRQENDTPQSPSPLNVMSESTNISQSGFHRATTGPTLQGTPSHVTMAKKALSVERLDSAADAIPGAASRRREPQPTDNQTTAHPAVVSRGRQATTGQFDVELDARSRAGKPPLDVDNTQNVSTHNIFVSRETRAAQREGITNSGTVVSASSMQQPVHLVPSSPPSLNALPSLALGKNSSNISLPVAAPRPEETRKRNESPHPQEDSRSQRTIIRPHAEQIDRIASVQPSAKPPVPSSPPFSSGERNVTSPHADPVSRTASSSVQPSIKPPTSSIQPSVKLPTSYPPPPSSSERRANTPHAEQVDRITSIQPSAKPSIPSSPPFSSGERNVTRPHTDPVSRTASSSVQPSIKPPTSSIQPSVKPPTSYPPAPSSSERRSNSPHAEQDDRITSIQPSAKPSVPSSPPFSSGERNVTRPHADPVNRSASSSVQPSSITPSASSIQPSVKPPPSSSSERRANTPHAEQVDRIASIQPSAKPSVPSSPPFSSSERNATRPHADPVNRTASGSVQPSIKPSSPYPPPSSSSEINETRPRAEQVNRTASVRPPAKPSTPTPPSDRPSASILPPSSPPAPALAKGASNQMHPPSDMLSYESKAPFREILSESTQPPLVDHHTPYVYIGAPDLQSPSGSSSSGEHDEPVPVQSVPMERHTGDGPRMHVTGNEGGTQQRTGSGANGSGDRLRSEYSHEYGAQSQRTGVTSPAYPDPKQVRDDDGDPLLDRKTSSGTGKSRYRPSRAVGRDEHINPGAAQSPPRSPRPTERDQPSRSQTPPPPETKYKPPSKPSFWSRICPCL